MRRGERLMGDGRGGDGLGIAGVYGGALIGWVGFAWSFI